MNVLGERECEAVQSVLASLEQDVAVTLELGPTAVPVTLLAAGGREIDTGAQTLAVLEDVCSLSEPRHAGRRRARRAGALGPAPRSARGSGISACRSGTS